MSLIHAVFGSIIGLMGLAILPTVVRGTDYGRSVGNWFANVASEALGRGAIGVESEHEMKLRKLSWEESYRAEKVGEKLITPVKGTVNRWGKRPFTFVDEVKGVTFDLRDVAFGAVEHNAREAGQMVYTSMDTQDGQIRSISHSYRAVLGLEGGHPLDMDLDESVRPLVDGSEDALAWKRTWEGVKRMFALYGEPISMWRLMLPILSTIGGLVLGAYVFGPGSLPGGETNVDSTISFGAFMLIAAPTLSKRVKKVLGVLLVGGIVTVCAMTMGIVPTIWFVGGIVVGGFVPWFISVFIVSALPARICEPVAEAWMKFGLSSFKDPLIWQQDGEFSLEERDEKVSGEKQTYRFCKEYVEFGTATDSEQFGEAGYTAREADAIQSGELDRANHTGAIPHIPENDESTYVATARWMGRFKNSSTGQKQDKAQAEATKEFAGGMSNIDDGTLLKYSLLGFGVTLGLTFLIWGMA